MLTLKSSTDFQRVRRNGRSWSHPLLVLIACPQPQPLPMRCGITVSKSVGNAVQRNRVKRRLRAAFRAQTKTATLAPQWDIVLIGRAPLVTAPWLEVTTAVQQLLHKAHLLHQ